MFKQNCIHKTLKVLQLRICICNVILTVEVVVVTLLVLHFSSVVGVAGADSVRFKAEINMDGREVTRVHLSRLDMEAILKVRIPGQ